MNSTTGSAPRKKSRSRRPAPSPPNKNGIEQTPKPRSPGLFSSIFLLQRGSSSALMQPPSKADVEESKE